MSGIVQTGRLVLRERAEEVDVSWIGTPEFDTLINDMIETMRKAPGVGLAAPQIDVSLRIFVVEDRSEVVEALDDEVVSRSERHAVPLRVFVNPTLEVVDDEMVEFYEGCLSVAGFAAIVNRYRRVRVRALNERGEVFEVEWQGWPARILQHEFDHLDGELYIDRMDSRTFSTVRNLHYDEDDEDDEDSDRE